uniref:Uncharacterized protein n=1 Tax=Panagrolaimus sp. PS1159 TaxID=55785 RepID=A0AC35GY27_9BILA
MITKLKVKNMDTAETETENQMINDKATLNSDNYNHGGIHIGGKDYGKINGVSHETGQNIENSNEDHHHYGGVFVGGFDKSKEYGTESKKLEEINKDSSILGNMVEKVQDVVAAFIPNTLKTNNDHHNTGGIHVGGDNHGSISYNGKSKKSKKDLRQKRQERCSKNQNTKGNIGGYHVDGDNYDDIIYTEGDQQSNL